VWKENPVSGSGPVNYELRGGELLPGVRTHAYNYFLRILTEQGIIGVVLFVCVVVATLMVLLRTRQQPAVIAAIAITFAFCAHQVLDSLLLYPKIGITYWLFVAIALANGTSRSINERPG